MTVPLPQPLPTATVAGWTVTNRFARTYAATADANGTATATCDQLADYQLWQVEHVTCSTTSSAVPSVRLYESTVDPVHLLDGIDSASLAVADWPLGLLVNPTCQLVVQWTGCTPGATCTVRVQTSVLQNGG